MRLFRSTNLKLRMHSTISAEFLLQKIQRYKQMLILEHLLIKTLWSKFTKIWKGDNHLYPGFFSYTVSDFRNNGRWLQSSFGGFSCAEILVHKQVDDENDEIQNENGSHQKQGLFWQVSCWHSLDKNNIIKRVRLKIWLKCLFTNRSVRKF